MRPRKVQVDSRMISKRYCLNVIISSYRQVLITTENTILKIIDYQRAYLY